jgi:peptide/nickel transport system permease protein
MQSVKEKEAEEKPAGKSPKAFVKEVLSSVKKDKRMLIGFVIVVALFVTAVVAAISSLLKLRITPFDPLQQNVGPSLAGPSLAHLFGTDILGRDVFSRIVVATPNSLAVSLGVVGVAFTAGAMVGSFAAFKGGLLDELLMRFTDVIFALPALVLAMVISVALGHGIVNMMIALMIIWWPPYARLARGESLKVAHQNYIEAARLSGFGTTKIVFKHVLPNIFVTMLVYATLDVGTVVLVYSGLSYLGLSVRPPQPDWGEMVSSSQDYLIAAPWLPVLPGVVIALMVVGFSLLGDGIRHKLGAT